MMGVVLLFGNTYSPREIGSTATIRKLKSQFTIDTNTKSISIIVLLR